MDDACYRIPRAVALGTGLTTDHHELVGRGEIFGMLLVG